MSVSFDGKLVVAISSRALFDLEESNRVFEQHGIEAYSRYQLEREDELLAPGIISATYVTGVARAERGAWPLGVADVYGIDDAHLAMYAKAARTREGFEGYLREYVWQERKSSLPA